MNSLKRRSAVALAWDFGGLLVNRGSGFIISIFLARLLSPEEFGLIGMAMAFIAISQAFIDVGFVSALIQRKENTNLTYSSVFYFNILSGFVLTIIFYFVAPFIGDFYGNSDVTAILRWLSLSFLFNSLNQVQSAILIKELNFRVLTIRNVTASIMSGVFGVIAAFQGFGVYSLVIQTLSNGVMSTVLLWSISNWKPSFSFSYSELKSLTSFSVFVFFDVITSSVFSKLDVFFIGKAFSSATLGFYSRAESLNSQVTSVTASSISKVFFPVLSSLKDDVAKFNSVYFKIVSLISFVSFILSGILYALAEPIIIGLFGEKWFFSILIFQILVFKSFNVPLNSVMLQALLGKGFAKENFKIGLARKVIRTLPIGIGLIFGLIPFLWSVVVVSYGLTIFNIYFIQRYLQIKMLYHLRKVFEGAVPFFLLTLCLKIFQIDTLFNLILSTLIFVIVYVFYASIIKMEGYQFIKFELLKYLKKN